MLNYRLSVAAGILLAAFFMTFGCGGQDDSEGDGMISFLPEQAAGWTADGQPARYDTVGIYDYMNGAGEIYRMYDYRDMIVQRYTKPDAPPVTVEIFDMGKAEDAYGVFSHSRENEYTSPGGGAEIYAATVVFWKGRYLVSIVAEMETNETKPAVLEIADAIAVKIEGDTVKPALVRALPSGGLQAHSVRFFHIHTSLNYHYYISSENILNLSPETDAVMGKYEPGEAYVLIVQYPSESDVTEAERSFIENYAPEAAYDGFAEIESESWFGVDAHSNYLIAILDAPSKAMALDLVQKAKARLTTIDEQERE
jgi:hypothetical protein